MRRDDVLYHIVCGAPPAADADVFVAMAKKAGWDVCVVVTSTATRFADLERLSLLTGRPVRQDYKRPGEADLFPPPSAIVVAPATFSTVNKLVAGIADTLALSLLCEHLSSVPIVLAPNVNPALAAHPQYSRSVVELRNYGARVLEAQTERSVAAPAWMQPWERVLEALPTIGHRY